MGITKSIYDVENVIVRVVEAVMFGAVCFFSLMGFQKALNQANLHIKILCALLIVYCGYTCLNTALSVIGLGSLTSVFFI